MDEPIEDEIKIVRDVRIDKVGLVDELYKLYAKPLYDDSKKSLLAKDADQGEGDLFDGLIVKGDGTRVINPQKYYELFQAGVIDEEFFLSSISVNVKAAGDKLSKDMIKEISTLKPTAPSLRINRKKGVAIELLTVMEKLNTAIRG